ncbi:chaperone modulator CbpM [Thiotrichales bacterium 19S11-10]|nr:chaperone modulator CbpM [Thiotrichales bacterium 19S11-10]
MKSYTGVIVDEDLISIDQVCDLLCISEKVIIEWIEHDVVYAIEKENVYYISCNQLVKAKSALRLARDLGINAPGIAVIHELREKIKALEALLDQDDD